MEKGIFSKEGFLEMVAVVNFEIRKVVQAIHCDEGDEDAVLFSDEKGLRK